MSANWSAVPLDMKYLIEVANAKLTIGPSETMRTINGHESQVEVECWIGPMAFTNLYREDAVDFPTALHGAREAVQEARRRRGLP